MRRAVISVLFLSLSGALFWGFGQQNSGKKEADTSLLKSEFSPGVSRDVSVARNSPVSGGKPLEGVTDNVAAKDSSGLVGLSDEEIQSLKEEHPGYLEMVIFGENEFIRTFKILSEKKVLLTEKDAARLQEMLTDQEAVIMAETFLSTPMHQGNFYRQQLERMYYIDFLQAALESPGNPAFDQIVMSIRSVILSDNLDPALPSSERKSMASEKAELISLLSRYDLASLEFLRNQAPVSRHRKLLEHFLTLIAVDNPRF